MLTFESESQYIDSQTSNVAKIAAIDAIISALLTTAATAATKDHIREYWLNDGQTQIKTIYKGVDQILASIHAFEKLKQMYMSRVNGRVTRLIDSKNLR